MTDIYCMIAFVLLLPILMMAIGLVYIFKKDLAWRYVEMMLRSVKPQRTQEWERNSTVTGVILLVSGLAIALFLLYELL